MNNFYNCLEKVCQEDIFEEKILVMPSYSAGRQVLEAATKRDIPVLNLKVERVQDIMLEEVAGTLYSQGRTIIDSKRSKAVLLSLLQKLTGDNKLNYFNRLELTEGLLKIIYNSLYELRMSGIAAEELDRESFINPEKGEDIVLILQSYRQTLKKCGYIDIPGALKIAIKEDLLTKGRIYLRPDSLELLPLERKYLKRLIDEGREYILPGPGVYGLKRSNYYAQHNVDDALETISSPDHQAFSFLYDLEELPEKIKSPKIIINSSYGEINEIKGIFRQIKRAGIPLDQTAVLYTAREPYSQLLYDFSQKEELQLTFGQGVDIRNTRPGRIYFSLITWINEDFSARILYDILTGGVFKTDLNSDSHPYQEAKLLRELGVGWGKQRYKSLIEKKLKGCQEKQNQGENGYLKQRIKGLKGLNSIIKVLVEDLPMDKERDKVNLSSLAEWLIQVLKKYAKIAGKHDAEAREAIIDRLSIFSKDSDYMLEIDSALNYLKDLVSGERVGVSTPQPGHLHITSYQQGIWTERENIFVVGLDVNKFPGTEIEDPVLLNSEREQIKGLDIKNNQILEKVYKLNRVMASSCKNLYLSYSNYDTYENRKLAPSPLLLQAYRLKHRNPQLDYCNLVQNLDNYFDFIPCDEEEVLDEAEFWLYMGDQGRGITRSDFLKKLYPGLDRGNLALKLRYGDQFNEYNGKVAVDAKLVDPRRNKRLVTSASMLEQMAKCPFGYFCKYILRISPPEDIERDTGSWLDSLSRGILLHRVYEEFYQRIKKQGENPSLKLHEDLIYRLAEERAEKLQEELPSPSQLVYQLEMDEIKQSCRFFLADEEEKSKDSTPCYFELSFGKDQCHQELGEMDNVELMLPSGDRIALVGKIDRVDILSKGEYNIVDYKTGSTYSFSDKDYFKRGKQLQHALYALAFEELMGADTSVNYSGYLFSSLKGQGRFMRSSEKRNKVLEIIGILLETVSQGFFPAGPFDNDNTDCNICDYKDLLCYRQKGDALTDLYYQSNALEDLRRLNSYE